ncbi:carbohydrate binding domain-containing protein [Dictyobacter kobayashii]|uniref:CBM-cenC domain-containing protein n=1 Tax=Dictyobacter kobayashii TaxID=2014872 RepID=A0A402AS91_9CHLR|nr:carbohydrate binding domain-containing protein [Dictyobacter kobayashii]GCE21970.1 hypothetical protein KDK_57700 [Dictyobacter kobayashii]
MTTHKRSRICRHFLLVALVCMTVGAIAVFLPEQHTAHAANFTWSLGSDTPFTQMNNEDLDPGVLHDGSNLWVIYSSGENIVHRLEGTTMDNLVEQSNGVLDSSFNKPYGDDRYWFGGMWSDGSTWYATVHIEFHYGSGNFNHFRRIDMATSTDHGATWHDQGDILTSDNSYNQSDYPNGYIDFGDGDQKLFVDTASGYFYIYYMHAWVDTTQDVRYQSMRVARCPISAKMAPGCWEKWYNNSWTQPGLGGRDSDVFTNEDSSTVFYDTYLHKYVAIGNFGAFISTATDLNTQNWTPREAFATGRLQWYNWPIDPTTWDRYTIGQSFRLYSASNDADGQTKYMTVTFGSGSTTFSGFTPYYAPVSVNDANPGWQRNFPTGAYNSTYTNNFDGGLAGWQTVYQPGNSSWSQSGDTLVGTVNDGSEIRGIDTNAPNVADGDLSFTVNPVSGSRLGAIFRYTSNSNFAMIYYDNGVVGYQNANTYAPLFNLSLSSGTWHTFEIGFNGSNITITIDYVQKYSGSIPALPTNAGQIGFRTWSNSTNIFDSVVEAYNNNRVSNPGFESGSFSSWTNYGSSSVVATNAHSGTYAAQLGTSSAIEGTEQVINGLSPNTTYTLTGWAKVTNPGDTIYIGVKGFDSNGTENKQGITSTTYTQATVSFTTGPNSTSATIYLFMFSASAPGYGDDFVVG